MQKVADDVFLLKGFSPKLIIVYTIGDVLLDAGTRGAERRIMRPLQGRNIMAHALTHAHADHQGSSHAVCEALVIPLWCGEADKEAVESGDLSHVVPQNAMTRFSVRLWAGPGHLAYWRESDRVLILGDVLNNMNLFTGIPGLNEPPKAFTVDPALDRESAHKLGALKPETICFGHGAPLHDGEKFAAFIDALP